MNGNILLYLLAGTVAAMEKSKLDQTFSTSVNELESIILELLSEIKEIKIKQENDLEVIKRNREDIIKLREENEKLKATIIGCDLYDQQLKAFQEELKVNDTFEITRKEKSKRGLTLAPTPTRPPGKAAFSAKLSSYEHHIVDFETIVYDIVITNVGGHYSATTGRFTAPEDGTYFFLASSFSCKGGVLETYLNRNGESLVSMHADDDSGHETGAAGIVLVLKGGDIVYVVHKGHEGECVYGEFSNFSGFQIN